MIISGRDFREPPLLFLLAILLLGAFLAPPTVYSQPEGESHEAEHEEHKESGFHHVSLFLGVTDKKDSDPEFTTGIDYIYRLAPPVGFVALFDNPRVDFRDWIFAAGFVLYPLAESFIIFAPGFEIQDGHDTEILFRLGFGYNIPIGRSQFTIAPALNLDFVGDETVFVYGLNFGAEFGR